MKESIVDKVPTKFISNVLLRWQAISNEIIFLLLNSQACYGNMPSTTSMSHIWQFYALKC